MNKEERIELLENNIAKLKAKIKRMRMRIRKLKED